MKSLFHLDFDNFENLNRILSGPTYLEVWKQDANSLTSRFPDISQYDDGSGAYSALAAGYSIGGRGMGLWKQRLWLMTRPPKGYYSDGNGGIREYEDTSSGVYKCVWTDGGWGGWSEFGAPSASEIAQ